MTQFLIKYQNSTKLRTDYNFYNKMYQLQSVINTIISLTITNNYVLIHIIQYFFQKISAKYLFSSTNNKSIIKRVKFEKKRYKICDTWTFYI